MSNISVFYIVRTYKYYIYLYIYRQQHSSLILDALERRRHVSHTPSPAILRIRKNYGQGDGLSE